MCICVCMRMCVYIITLIYYESVVLKPIPYVFQLQRHWSGGVPLRRGALLQRAEPCSFAWWACTYTTPIWCKPPVNLHHIPIGCKPSGFATHCLRMLGTTAGRRYAPKNVRDSQDRARTTAGDASWDASPSPSAAGPSHLCTK